MRLTNHLQIEQPALRQVSLKVAKVGGINLGQGVCQMPTPTLIIEAAGQAMQNDKNMYSPAHGVAELREAIANRLNSYNKISYTFENIVVTSGATAAFEAVCAALLRPGDEVISFVPYYPYHNNALMRAGVKINYVQLFAPNWDFEPSQIESYITPRTKFILLNSPNNPTGKVFTREELQAIAKICIKHDLLCVTDETYEYITYDGHSHISMAALSEMQARCITISSYSKTFAITGWRVGYLAAPLNLVPALRTLYDQIYVCAPTPLQHAVATGIAQLRADYYVGMQQSYLKKRRLLLDGLNEAGLKSFPCQGAYYLLADTSERFPGITSDQAVDILIEKTKVGAVPASDFIGEEAKSNPLKGNFFRFCFALPDDLLENAVTKLRSL